MSRRWVMVSALVILSAIALAQGMSGSRTHAAPTSIDWATVSHRDLVTAALYLDVQEGGPGEALQHLIALAGRDSTVRQLAHGLAHEIGRYALAHYRWDPRIYAQCTPEFYAGCNHGLIEAYINHIPSLDFSELSQLCNGIVGPVAPEVGRRECTHGLGHGLWFRLHGQYRKALSHCDRLSDSTSQEECRDGVFMQRAAPAAEHGHSRAPGASIRSLECTREPSVYQRACWHYEGRLQVQRHGGYQQAFLYCDTAGKYVEVCYWGLGKWIAGQVRQAGGSNEQIVNLCRQGRAERFGSCLAGAAETLVDENWTIEPAERLCQMSPVTGRAACYAKLQERIAILRSVGKLREKPS